jgi:hypothetical protein
MISTDILKLANIFRFPWLQDQNVRRQRCEAAQAYAETLRVDGAVEYIEHDPEEKVG